MRDRRTCSSSLICFFSISNGFSVSRNVNYVIHLSIQIFNNNKINDFYVQNEIQIIPKSENTIILGIIYRDNDINSIVNMILTTTKWFFWKERNVAKYQKKEITKLKIIKLKVKFHSYFLLSKVKRERISLQRWQILFRSY